MLHDFADVFVDFAHIDDMYTRLRGQIPVIEHGRSGAIVVGGAKQVRTANVIDIPVSATVVVRVPVTTTTPDTGS